MTQWYYFETIALFTLFHKRLGKVRHVNPDAQLSDKPSWLNFANEY